MFKLRLNAKACLSCGICLDVCSPRAIAMRLTESTGVEGALLSYLEFHTDGEPERPPEALMTFPYLAFPHRCDGCALCINECPVTALALKEETPQVDQHPVR